MVGLFPLESKSGKMGLLSEWVRREGEGNCRVLMHSGAYDEIELREGIQQQLN